MSKQNLVNAEIPELINLMFFSPVKDTHCLVKIVPVLLLCWENNFSNSANRKYSKCVCNLG